MFNTVLFIAELIGIIAFAVSGAMLAAEKNLDIFGIIVLGVVTAFGGGVLRDLLLGITPPSMFTNFHCFWATTLSSVLVFFIYRYLYRRGSNHHHLPFNIDYRGLVNFFDAIGLGVFSLTGTQVAINCGHGDNPLLAISLGVITGVGGGMIRDVLNNEIPGVLRKHIYALAAILGAGFYYIMITGGFPEIPAVVLGFLATFVIRMAATYYRWHLPRPNDNDTIDNAPYK